MLYTIGGHPFSHVGQNMNKKSLECQILKLLKVDFIYSNTAPKKSFAVIWQVF